MIRALGQYSLEIQACNQLHTSGSILGSLPGGAAAYEQELLRLLTQFISKLLYFKTIIMNGLSSVKCKNIII